MKKDGNIVVLITGLLGAAKLALEAFGYSIITDDQINAIANGVAAAATWWLRFSTILSDQMEIPRHNDGGNVITSTVFQGSSKYFFAFLSHLAPPSIYRCQASTIKGHKRVSSLVLEISLV
ncbi:hypothetical protein [Brevibacillus sp. LEMMJ03]|uniref:hypothetical protein n=1 Tax=Brevibacillus sp. LEMMJ03 TaxID=2595056 RepID=UPI002105330A|nr:hypothetical protein [Brevibacillus sp. LEMMJ03]